MTLRVSVIGDGRVGSAHAARLARLGHEVVRPGPDGARAHDCDVHFLCVDGAHAADDRCLIAQAVRAVGDHFDGNALLVIRSNATGGSLRILDQLAADGGPDARLAVNPVIDGAAPLIYGVGPGPAENDVALLDRVYADDLAAGVPRVVTDHVTAELAASAGNAFLATKIAFFTVMTQMCDAVGADITDLAEVLGRDPRIGPALLDATIDADQLDDVRALRSAAEMKRAPSVAGLLRIVASIDSRRR